MNGKEICKFCGLEFGNKSVLEIHYSIVHQGEEQINKSDSIQGILPEKNMNFETTIKTQNKKRTLKSKQENDETVRRAQCNVIHIKPEVFDSDTDQTYSFTDGKQHLNQTLNSNIASVNEEKSSDGSKINNGHEIKLSCRFCTLSYPSKKCLKRHIATAHEGKMQEKKFKCTLCDNAAFTQKHNLKKHIESFHEGKKAFRCNICDLRFTQNGGLKIHIQYVHEGKKRKKVQEM